MHAADQSQTEKYAHGILASGVEYAVDELPQRNTVALCFRMLSGVADDPAEQVGIGSIMERTLAKGTQNYDRQQLADAFDLLGAQRGGACGRQSTLARVLCLPEYVERVVELITETLCRPVFPDDACEVAVKLAQDDLKHMEDDPQDLLRVDIQRLTLGPIYGRNPSGEPETLARITPEAVRSHWKNTFHAGRLQVSAAGPIDTDAFAKQLDRCFAGLGDATCVGRNSAAFDFAAGRHHRAKDLKQQYIAITLKGTSKGHADEPAERVLLGVLSGGMGARLFTEVREKQGLVYWVGAWNEQPRDRGVIHLGASTTPENCERTLDTLLRELERLGEDLTEEETRRARDGLVAHMQTEDDLTRARAGGLSDDLFHFSRPIGPTAKIDAIRAVTTEQVIEYARRLPREQLCIATVGPRELDR